MNPGNDVWGGDYDENESDFDGISLTIQETTNEDSLIAQDELCLAPPTIFGFSFTLKEWGEVGPGFLYLAPSMNAIKLFKTATI